MKYCGKCGRELDENTGLCPKCSKKEEKNAKKTFKKKHLVIPTALLLICAIVTGILLATGIVGNLFKNKTIDGKIEFKSFTNDDVVFENDELFVKNQLLITVDDDYTYSDVEKTVKEYDGKIVGCIEYTNDYQVEFKDANYDDLKELEINIGESLKSSDIGLHKVFYQDFSSSDEKLQEGNWWRDAIELSKLEEKNYDYSNVNVGIYDTLFQNHNTDLEYAFENSEIWVNNEANVGNPNIQKSTHGTNVLGFWAADKNNKEGIKGVANNVNVYAYASFEEDFNDYGDNRYYSSSSVLQIKYVLAKMFQKNVKVINLSYGLNSISVPCNLGDEKAKEDMEILNNSLEKFLLKNIERDFVIVKSAGNDNNDKWIRCDYSEENPYGFKIYEKDDGDINETDIHVGKCTADYDFLGAIKNPLVACRIIVVGSSDVDNKRSDFSNAGKRVDIYAPGENLKRLYESDFGAGTSYSSPIVAGVVTLMWGINPDIPADSIKYLLVSSVSQPIEGEKYQISPDNGDVVYAYKYLVNAKKAVERAKDFKVPHKDSLDSNNGALMGLARKIDRDGNLENLSEECDISIYEGTEDDIYKMLSDPNYVEPTPHTNIKTDSFGEFYVELPEGNYYIKASLNNHEYMSVTRAFSIKKGEVTYFDDINLLKIKGGNYVSGDYLIEIDGKIICAKSDGIYYKESIDSQETKIASANDAEVLMSDGQTVFYVVRDSSNLFATETFDMPHTIYSVNIDGSDNKKVCSSKSKIEPLTCYSGNLYYFKQTDYGFGTLNKVDLSTGANIDLGSDVIKEYSENWVDPMGCLGDKIYFYNQNHSGKQNMDSIISYDLTNGQKNVEINNASFVFQRLEQYPNMLYFYGFHQNEDYTGTDTHLYIINSDNELSESIELPSNLSVQIMDSNCEYVLCFNDEQNDIDTMFDMYRVDLKTGEVMTSKGEAGRYKNKNYFVTYDLANPEDIYFMYNVGLYDKTTNKIINKKCDNFEINITKSMWIIDGYVVDSELNTYQIYDESNENVNSSDVKEISSEEMSKIVYEYTKGDLVTPSEYIKYNGKSYRLYDISRRVDDGDGRFHYSHIGYTIISMDGMDVRNVDYVDGKIQEY